jgi:hypothetical protein
MPGRMPVKMPVTMRGWMREILGEGMTPAVETPAMLELKTVMPWVEMMAPLEGMMDLPRVMMEELPATATETVMMVEVETMVVEGMREETKDL